VTRSSTISISRIRSDSDVFGQMSPTSTAATCGSSAATPATMLGGENPATLAITVVSVAGRAASARTAASMPRLGRPIEFAMESRSA